MHTKKIQHFAEAAFWPAALLRRASVLAEGQNLGAGGIHFRRACEVLTVSIKITTPKGVVIFMVEAGRVELPSENPSMETSPGADGYSGRRDRPVPLAPGKPSRLEVR